VRARSVPLVSMVGAVLRDGGRELDNPNSTRTVPFGLARDGGYENGDGILQGPRRRPERAEPSERAAGAGFGDRPYPCRPDDRGKEIRSSTAPRAGRRPLDRARPARGSAPCDLVLPRAAWRTDVAVSLEPHLVGKHFGGLPILLAQLLVAARSSPSALLGNRAPLSAENVTRKKVSSGRPSLENRPAHWARGPQNAAVSASSVRRAVPPLLRGSIARCRSPSSGGGLGRQLPPTAPIRASPLAGGVRAQRRSRARRLRPAPSPDRQAGFRHSSGPGE
jgi:hypothetical protein